MSRRAHDPDLHGPGLWVRVYQATLLLYPRSVRLGAGPDMVRTFRRRFDEAVEEGRTGTAVWLLARELLAAPWFALRAWLVRDRGVPTPRASGLRRAFRSLGLELKQATRRLRRTPGFTAAAVSTLALGIGATASVFSLVQSTVIDPLPYPDSDRLVWLDHAAPGIGSERGLAMSDGLFAHYAPATARLEDMAIWLHADYTLGGDEPERVKAAVVTPSFFTAMRTLPVAGRPFTNDQARAGAAGVVVSQTFARRHFGEPHAAVGRTLRLDGSPVEIAGVMPAGFEYPTGALDMWAPLWVDPMTSDFGGFARGGVARLAPGATRESAEAELAGLLASLPDRFGPGVQRMLDEAQLAPILPSLKEETVRESERTLWILLGSVAFVLLLTCANVANLLLVRAEGRHRETALRRALGAGRAELVRYFMSESLLLSLAGGLLGVGLATVAVRLLVGYGPADLPRIEEVSVGLPVIGVALTIAFATSVLFGLLPALRRVPSLAHTIKSGDARSSLGRQSTRSRGILVATQVALALMLLVATGLMSRSFSNLVTADPGFDAESVLTFSLGLPAIDYPDREQAVAFHRAVVDRLAGLTGVEAVAVTNCLPLCGSWAGTQLSVEGREPAPGDVAGVVAMRRVSEGFFEAARLRMVEGRLPTRGEHEAQVPVAVISRRLAETYWPDENPIGQRFRNNAQTPWFEVVGIVGNTPVRALSDDPVPMAYLPLLPGSPIYEASSFELSYVVRTSVPPQAVLIAARDVIREMDADVPIANVSTLEQTVRETSVSTAFTMVVLAVAAGISLLLGVVGIYGVISYTVGQRAREIGIRLALGARSSQVSRAVLAQGWRVAAAGIAVGLLGAWGLTRVMRSLLFGVSPTDPLTFAGVPVLLMLVALGASWIPARRAARVDPARTLRSD